jgi:hypothetical protein
MWRFEPDFKWNSFNFQTQTIIPCSLTAEPSGAAHESVFQCMPFFDRASTQAVSLFFRWLPSSVRFNNHRSKSAMQHLEKRRDDSFRVKSSQSFPMHLFMRSSPMRCACYPSHSLIVPLSTHLYCLETQGYAMNGIRCRKRTACLSDQTIHRLLTFASLTHLRHRALYSRSCCFSRPKQNDGKFSQQSGGWRPGRLRTPI